MNKKLSFEVLTQNQAVVKTTNTIIMDGIEYIVEQPSTKCYINSVRGRKEIKELPENFQNIILCMWGDTPTVEDKTDNKTIQ